jgi:opacity protein-like surface antigen
VGSGQTDFTGRDFRVTTWAFNLLARYPGKTLQPYAGLGMGINWAYLYDGQTGDTQNSSDVGLNALIGLRYLATESLFVFGEWKFNQASFSFADTANLTGQNVTYNAQHVVFGVGLRF